MAEVISLPDSFPHITAAQVHIRWIFRQDYRHPLFNGSCQRALTFLAAPGPELLFVSDEAENQQRHQELSQALDSVVGQVWACRPAAEATDW